MSPARAVTVDQARSDLASAYVAVESAEAAGGNVTALVWRLNIAAALIDTGKVDEASQIIGEVMASAPQVQMVGAERITNRYIVTGVALVLLVAAGVLVWLRGSRWYWGAWLRAHRGWRIEKA